MMMYTSDMYISLLLADGPEQLPVPVPLTSEKSDDDDDVDLRESRALMI